MRKSNLVRFQDCSTDSNVSKLPFSLESLALAGSARGVGRTVTVRHVGGVFSRYMRNVDI